MIIKLNSCLILAIAFIGAVCYPNDIIRQCKKTDEACIESSSKQALKKIYAGVPELNVLTSDPLDVGEINGDLSTLKFTFTDVVATGLIKCDIYNVKIDLDEPLLRLNLTCPDIVIKGNYKINGQLIVLPIEGEGPFVFDIKKYLISLVGEPKIIEGKDGKRHMMIKKYQATGEAHDGAHYDLQNLFGGQKDLGDTVLKFANENWKEVAEFVQGPIIDKIIKQLVVNVNKFFKNVPIEDIFLA